MKKEYKKELEQEKEKISSRKHPKKRKN